MDSGAGGNTPVVTHYHHHFTFYLDGPENAMRAVSTFSLSQTVDLLIEDEVAAVPDNAKHVHRHLFHRLKRGGTDDLIAVSEADKAEARAAVGPTGTLVQHHFYDTVRVRNTSLMMMSLAGRADDQVARLRQMLRSVRVW